MCLGFLRRRGCRGLGYCRSLSGISYRYGKEKAYGIKNHASFLCLEVEGWEVENI